MGSRARIFQYIFLKFIGFYCLANSEAALIEKILSNYQKQASVAMKVKKTFNQPLLKKQTQSEGRFYLAQKLWRLDLTSPRPVSFIYDGVKITYISGDVSHHIPRSKVDVLHLLFDFQSFSQAFKYEEKSRKGRTWIYAFKGLKPSVPERIFIQVEIDRILSLRVQRAAPLGEEFYRFSSIHFNRELRKNLFQAPLKPKKIQKKKP